MPAGWLFARDMLVMGSLLNVVATFVALIIVSQDGPPAVAVAAHFAPLPYNVFLFVALLRAPATPLLAAAGAIWLAVMTIV